MQGPVSERLARLLDGFSPWAGIALTYRQFAAEIGPSVTEAAIKKWPQRKKFPADIARLIVSRARERGLVGVTLEWVLWGEGAGPQKGAKDVRATEPTAETASQEPHGQFAARIARALQADLSHNEFGQWSSAEVQHTVIWALKDLARRLRVLQFDMGETFELTDGWAGEIGLPVRSTEEQDQER
ncbi:MAG: hypothetical protein DMD60_02185 [Gemmatimonadetes bacterium]|nr:MAG: hypothetical protein DMD60_02185 [Gemmatimonadota bacterium]